VTKNLFADVVIIGGGASGIAAAISASKKGAKTILVEKSGMLGGLATQAQVGTICGLYARESYDTSRVGSFANNFRERLESKSNLNMAVASNGLAYLPYNFKDFEEVIYDLIKDERIEFFLHSVLFGVEYLNSSITSVQIISANEIVKIEAKAFIDATGEGLISKMCAKSLIEDNEYQAPGYVFRIANLSNVDGVTEQDLNLVLIRELLAAEKNNLTNNISSRFSVVPGSFKNRSVSLKFAYPFCRTANFNDLTELEFFGRKSIFDTFEVLLKNLDVFKFSEISMIASHVGIRSGQRTLGRVILTEEDVLNTKKCDDAIANGFWPIEIWNEDRKPTMKFFTSGDYYQISASSLRSLELDNLFMCGRGISADQQSISSARVIGTCFGTGTAAGILSAGMINKEKVENTIKDIAAAEEI
jgi:hypothetical protein